VPVEPLAVWLRGSGAHCFADEVDVKVGQGVALLAVANGRKLICIELRKAKEAEHSVRGCKPVLTEVLVADFVGLDAG